MYNKDDDIGIIPRRYIDRTKAAIQWSDIERCPYDPGTQEYRDWIVKDDERIKSILELRQKELDKVYKKI